MKKLLLLLMFAFFTNANAQFWTVKATGFTAASRGINSISIPSPTVVWAKAYDGAPPVPPATTPAVVREYTKSIDGGNTWTAGTINFGINNSNLNIGSITAVSAQVAWVSTFKSAGSVQGIYKTVNGGTAWTRQTTAAFNTGTDSFPNIVYFWDANIGFCQGDPASSYFEIYTTLNGGTTWTRVPEANIPAPLAGEYGYVNNYSVVGDVIWFGTNKGRMFKSLNKGLNWTVAVSPLDDFGGDPTTGGTNGSYTFTSATNGLLVASNGLLYETTDGAETWNIVNANGNYRLDHIAYVPNTTKVVSTSGAGSSYSLDNGLNWTEIDAIQHTLLAFYDETLGFTGGFSTSATAGGISKYTGTELKVENFIPFKFTVSPNPVVDVINVSNSENILTSEININDVNGRSVKSLKINNLNNFQVNVSDLNAGIYFLNITSDAGKVVKKFIKN